jgi:hypothetical protein
VVVGTAHDSASNHGGPVWQGRNTRNYILRNS